MLSLALELVDFTSRAEADGRCSRFHIGILTRPLLIPTYSEQTSLFGRCLLNGGDVRL